MAFGFYLLRYQIGLLRQVNRDVGIIGVEKEGGTEGRRERLPYYSRYHNHWEGDG